MQPTSSLSKKNKISLVSIIIANYNGKAYLEKCLSSVLVSNFKNFELLVIDDGSNDESVDIVTAYSKKDKRIILLKNGRNLGAAASRNKAAKKACGDILLFLDNDTVVDKNWIDEILNEFNSETDIGAVQAVLLDMQKMELIQNAGVKLWAEAGWGLPFFQWALYKKVKKKLPDYIIAISAALAVKKDAFLFVKGFDESESVVTEDLDFSWRLWIAGYKIKLARNSVVYHWTKDVNMRKNMKHTKELIYYYLTKNSLTSIMKNYEKRNAVFFFLYSTIINLSRGILVFFRRFEIQALKGSFKAFIFVVFNFRKILKARSIVQNTRRNPDSFLFESVLCRGNPLSVYKKHFTQTNLL